MHTREWPMTSFTVRSAGAPDRPQSPPIRACVRRSMPAFLPCCAHLQGAQQPKNVMHLLKVFRLPRAHKHVTNPERSANSQLSAKIFEADAPARAASLAISSTCEEMDRIHR